ncbi:STY0301 family protein [Azohydromonas caseinilytica]|nr:STY0301 family protein [Azohydromonas caseinilytica]
MAACCTSPAIAAGVCPAREGQPLLFVQVFDGPPEELATLVPDVATERSGYWQLGYVYDAGRMVTIRCEYVDKQSVDVKLADRVERCDYSIRGRNRLKLSCH